MKHKSIGTIRRTSMFHLVLMKPISAIRLASPRPFVSKESTGWGRIWVRAAAAAGRFAHFARDGLDEGFLSVGEDR